MGISMTCLLLAPPHKNICSTCELSWSVYSNTASSLTQQRVSLVWHHWSFLDTLSTHPAFAHWRAKWRLSANFPYHHPNGSYRNLLASSTFTDGLYPKAQLSSSLSTSSCPSLHVKISRGLMQLHQHSQQSRMPWQMLLCSYTPSQVHQPAS